MYKWFKTGADQPLIDKSSDEIRSIYKKKQWSVILWLIIGYSFFYTTRLSLVVAKKPLIDSGIMSKEQLGLMGSVIFFSYAVGKFTNGILADHANVRRFMSFGLFCSALINIFLGFGNTAVLFIVLWGFNGWVQSMGSAPAGVSIFQWFSPRQRGTWYSTWAGSHNIGEGITFVITSFIVSALGWRSGFIAPGILCLIIVVFMMIYLKDRPQTLGLPCPATAFDETPDPKKKGSTLGAQLFILKSPIVWIISISCAAMYVSRYAINSWAILYLQEIKNYSLTEAGTAMAAYPILGLAGAVLAGLISDKFFDSKRPMPTVLYGLCNIGGMMLLFWGPENRILDAVALGIFGFGIGGLIVFLSGLMAADLMPKNAVGAIKGFIGLFAYLGASLQEYVSSVLIKTDIVGGVKVYDFSSAVYFWIAAGVLSILLVFPIWNQKPVKFN